MPQRSRTFQFASLLWSLFFTVLVIILAGSILLPSTKSARIDIEELRRRQAVEEAAAIAASTIPPATLPSADPTPEP